LPVRSTTALRKGSTLPADGPALLRFEYHPGSVLTISIEPDYEFNDRSGTRKKAIEMWQTDIPQGDLVKFSQNAVLLRKTLPEKQRSAVRKICFELYCPTSTNWITMIITGRTASPPFMTRKH
jgi:hypothetical protein